MGYAPVKDSEVSANGSSDHEINRKYDEPRDGVCPSKKNTLKGVCPNQNDGFVDPVFLLDAFPLDGKTRYLFIW